MSDRMALKIAVDLMHVPSQVRLFRSEPLPDGVLTLLRIAAGDDDAESTAAALIDRSRDVVRQAATFFIEQILFAPNSDSYRVLGVSPQATGSELRRNVALLLRWLHPDLDPASGRSIFVGRVTAAWNDLKTPERRAAYDEQLRAVMSSPRSRKRKSRFVRQGSEVQQNRYMKNAPLARGANRIGFFRRALSMLLDRPLY